MIVVDTNITAYLLLPGVHSNTARQVFQKDPVWAAPSLWRSEFRNVLARYMRTGHVTLPQALALQSQAEELFAGREYAVNSAQVLESAAATGCSAYDCEFVTLARVLGVLLVTGDAQVLQAFPGTAIAPATFGETPAQ